MSRGDMLKTRMSGEIFLLNDKTMDAMIGMGSYDVSETAKDNMVYEEIGNVAVISIDGAMAKKTQQGLCMNVHGYDTVASYINQAENNSAIDTLICRVDSPGGHVDGVDDLEDRLFKSPLRTITLYENSGESAAIYAFSASDEIYATKSTVLGSIGAKATILMPSTDDNAPKTLSIVSRNAENKVCDLEGDCIDKLQVRIDKHEQLFLDVVAKNTGLSEDTIIEGFGNGDSIFADEALSLGFLDGITTFHELLNKEVTGRTIPTATRNNLVKTQGENMDFNQENFNALLAEKKTFKAAHETLESRNNVLEAKLAEVIASKGVVEEKLSANKEEIVTTMLTRLREASAQDVSMEAAILMIEANSDEEASKIALNAGSMDVLGGADGGATEMSRTQKNIKAYFEKDRQWK